MKFSINIIARVQFKKICFMDNIFVEEFNSVHKFQSFVEKLPRILEKHPEIKLVVIDSIAGIFRTEISFIERAKKIDACPCT